MKIALLYDAVYPYIKGGGEKRFYDFGKELQKLGHEVHIYGMKLWHGKNVIKKDGIYYHGLSKEMKLYDSNKKRIISQGVIFGISSFKMIKEDFDVIDAGNFPYFSLFSLRIVCWLKGRKLNVTWHEAWGREYWQTYIGKTKGYIGYLVEKLAVKMPDKIIAVSDYTKQELIRRLNVNPKKIVVIPNGVDIETIEKVKPSKEKSDLIFAGRLLSHKNVDLLIKSVSILKKKNKNIKVIIIGDGPEKKALETLTRDLGLEKNIIFKGFIESMKEVYALIKSSKVFVLPSTREGFGIVVIDANACGIPVITVKHKDNASTHLIKEGKNGFIAELTQENLIHKIEKGLKSYNLMRKDCKTISLEFEIKNVFKKLKEVYLI